jgi:hypothetical protein
MLSPQYKKSRSRRALLQSPILGLLFTHERASVPLGIE